MELYLKPWSTKITFPLTLGAGTFTGFRTFYLGAVFVGASTAAIMVFLDTSLAFCFFERPNNMLLLSFPNFWFLIPLTHDIRRDVPKTAL